MNDMQQIQWDDFIKVELRVGRVLSAEPFPQARKPAYVLQVDFGADIGVRKSSAQVTAHYRLEELVGRLVVAVVNFPNKQIGPLMSECLGCVGTPFSPASMTPTATSCCACPIATCRRERSCCE